MVNALLVFLGGGLGSLARYGISKIVMANFQTNFPLATFLANSISCIILAITVFYFQPKYSIDNSTKLFIASGVCGGFSTFSTFSFETFELFKTGYTLLAVANILLSMLVCLGLIYFISRANQ